MSAQANIIAFDGAATPMTHTFVPCNSTALNPDELVAGWREALTTVPTYAQIQVKTSVRRMKNGIYRVAISAEVPVMESISGQNAAGYTAAPKVAYTNTVQLVGYFHERSSIAERRLARQLLLNIGGGIATTVTPVVTGPAAELVDQLITQS